MQRNLRIIALHLPQYHPIPENDEWWGKGFTEWTNVTKAEPHFQNHRQPRLPADLGFYDLRLPETRAAQAELARAYGIEGFCYYHYWFHGKRLLDRPVEEILRTRQPNFPFCLCWANESWSRRWLGEEEDILISQTYSEGDDLEHIRWLVTALADPRCIKVNGRPLFVIYRPADLPDPERTLSLFRREAAKAGLPAPYLVGSSAHDRNLDCKELGFDNTLYFLPQLGMLPGAFNEEASPERGAHNQSLGINDDRSKVFDYPTALESMLGNLAGCQHEVIPSTFVGWDNTPRRGEKAIVMINSSPAAFERGLRQVAESVAEKPDGEQIIFIDAWNEWGEGNYLEPDRDHGHRYLEAVRRVKADFDRG